MENFFERLFGKERTPNPLEAAPLADEHADSGGRQNTIGIRIDLDKFGAGAREQVTQVVVQQSGAELFTGTVEHAYSNRKVSATERCPRCQAPTRLYCADFIYATNVAPRVMLAPAGYFCTACPTVIIDEDLIAASMKPGLQFAGVVGIDNPQTHEPILFGTWNGQKSVYIFDENQQVIGLENVATVREPIMGGFSVPGSPGHGPGYKKKKNKRKLAAQARRRNRRH